MGSRENPNRQQPNNIYEVGGGPGPEHPSAQFARDAYPVMAPPSYEQAAYGPQMPQRYERAAYPYDQTQTYQPTDGRQMQMSPQMQLQSIIGHLQNAERLVETRGPQAAMGEYAAAIQAADSVDQRAVMQYRAAVQRQLATEQNPQNRMALMQQDMDLHALQRAPGFTRANVGLLLERTGDQRDGLMLLMQAAARDPEMLSDPNFRRHYDQVMQQMPQGGYGPQYRPGDVPQQVVQQPGGGQAPFQPTDQTPRPGQQTTQPVELPPGQSPVTVVEALNAQLAKTGQLTPQMKALYESAIAASGKPSPILGQLQQQEAQVVQQIRGLLTPDQQQKVQQLDQQAENTLKQLPPDQQQKAAQLYNALDTAKSPQERQQIEQQLLQLAPGLKDILTQRDALTQNILPQLMQLNQKKADLDGQIVDEQNAPALTRFSYAQALQKAGDTQHAQQFMRDAFQLNRDPSVRAAFVQAAKAMGMSEQDLAKPGTTTDASGNPQTNQGGADGQFASFNLAKQTKAQFDNAQDKKAALAQLAPQFQQAITLSDNEYTRVAQQVAADRQQLQQQLAQVLPADKQQQLTQIKGQIDQAKAGLSPQDQQLYTQWMNPQTTDAQKQQIHDQLAKDAPQLVQLADQYMQLIQPALPIFAKAQQDAALLKQAQLNQFVTRFLYADSLGTDPTNPNGTNVLDKANGTRVLTEAFSKLSPDDAKAMAQDPDVVRVAARLQVDASKLQGQATTPGGGAPGGDAPINQPGGQGAGADASSLLQKAALDLQKNGMTDATKKEFQDAIKAADAGWTQQDQQTTDAAVNALKTGKKADGTALSAQDRLNVYALLQSEYAKALAPIQARTIYAQLLQQNKQYADEDKVYKEAVGMADKLPINAMKETVNAIMTDISNPQFNQQQQAALLDFGTKLQGNGNDSGLEKIPVTLRKQVALFYMGISPDGSQNKDMIKPQEAMEMINGAKNAEKQFFGIDLDKDPGKDPQLVSLANQVKQLLPEEIKKQQERASKLWSDPLIDTGIAVSAIAIATALATKNPDFFGLVEAGGLASKALIAGTVVATSLGERAVAHRLITGNWEDFGTTSIHALGADAAAGAYLLGRSFITNKLMGNMTAEGLLPRFEASFQAADGGVDAAALAAKMKEAGIVVPQGLQEAAAAGKSLTTAEELVNAGVLGADVAKNANLAAMLTKPILEGGDAALTSEAAALSGGGDAAAANATGVLGRLRAMPGNMLSGGKEFVTSLRPVALDPLTATSKAIGISRYYAGYGGVVGGMVTYNSFDALDRAPGESYGQAWMNHNFSSLSNNVFTDALWLAPLASPGKVAMNIIQPGIKGKLTAPFRALGPSGLIARTGPEAQAIYSVAIPHMYDALKGTQYIVQDHALGDLLDKEMAPIQNLTPPTPAEMQQQQQQLQREQTTPPQGQGADQTQQPQGTKPNDQTNQGGNNPISQGAPG